jgi:transcriptional regulator with XRE-family HTH domain
MVGGPSHDELIGVGPALRKAREHRALTLEEAARDTKLRVAQLQALESEDFEALGGEVYTRATLRTYAAYLGLNADKVMGAYVRHAEEPEPPPPPRKLGRVERAIAATRVRDNQRFLLIAAAALVVVLLIFGPLSRNHGAPPPATIPTQTPSAVPSGQVFDVTLTALVRAQVTVRVDGQPTSYTMPKGEQLSFTPALRFVVVGAEGKTVELLVAGHDLGAPGASGASWMRGFTYQQVSTWPSPSPSLSPSTSASATVSGSASDSATPSG